MRRDRVPPALEPIDLDPDGRRPHIAGEPFLTRAAHGGKREDTALLPDFAFSPAAGGPRGAGGPAIRMAGPVKLLLGTMVALQVGATLLPAAQWRAVENALVLVLFWRGEFLPERLYTLLTYALLHGDWGHLFFNGLWIAILGSKVHDILGPARFLLFFALATVIAGMTQVAASWGQTSFVVGASGFVYALIACIGHLYVVHPGDPPRERLKKLAVFTAAVFVLNVAFAYVAGGFLTAGGIAWEAHAGGFLAGLLLFPLLASSAFRARHGGAG
ncbi:hypothetical protein AY599_26630 [Leptolyngbya valderiana BDU 20041]|nr:hypothetical protein AY599_26630 [Leptolyngbya valderiana BDU 20041]